MTTFSNANGDLDGSSDLPGRFGPTATTEARPQDVGPVRIAYAPDTDGAPDPGEIVWTWVPYEERDGRGKDRPVLVVAREPEGAFLAVQLSSRPHDGQREWAAIGSGPWDREARESWVDLDRVLRVHEDGMRREACALGRDRFDAVVSRLAQRYGWTPA
ncbi:type II toxin-antitoxin system PemK/MazF family toxin [Streptomyces sp. ODS05-4]|uniref:type II toxin-antitoxin system PemK/MazF family toxin n=1 Tax=Streptomyces sp. ODS05-4 TaxID=2944939 RepID=UPI00210B70F1|nr:type II toxin-antitoxin system PemK/MazF family toxin [Streptomyces sp. ODS05-4]